MTNLHLRETVAHALCDTYNALACSGQSNGPIEADYKAADAAIAATGIERLLKREEALREALEHLLNVATFERTDDNESAIRKARTTLAETQEG